MSDKGSESPVESSGRFAGRVVIVTGGSSGIGRATALGFAREGALTIVADVSEASAEGDGPVTEDISTIGGAGEFAMVDMADTAAIDRLVERVVAEYGRLDVVVNNAATFSDTALVETSDAAWDRVQAVNVRGPFALCRAAVRQMLQQDRHANGVRGRIINLGSQHGIFAAPGDVAYGTSKAAVMYLTKQIAADYAEQGIVCNTVAPGKIYTGKGGWEDDISRQLTARLRTPWPRRGEAADVARSILFLSSDEATFVTGATLMVDGGWSAA